MKIGEIIRELRESKNMTKKELAEGICSSSYITRIEKGERCPTSVILRQITNKLGTNPEHLFRLIESKGVMNVRELLNKLYVLDRRYAFKEMYELICDEEDNLDIALISDQEIIRLFKIKSEGLITRDFQRAIDKLKDGLTFNESSPTYIEFAKMTIYGLFLLKNGQKEEAYVIMNKIKRYVTAIKFYELSYKIADYYLILAETCIETSRFDEAELNLEKAIEYCKEYSFCVLLRHLYILKSDLYYRLKDHENSKIWYDKAIQLHELMGYAKDDFFFEFLDYRFKE